MQIAVNIFFKPYFHRYGELFLSETTDYVYERFETDSCVAVLSDTYASGAKERCPDKSAFSTVIVALYMIISTLMLLNTLIAILSHTYDKIKETSDNYWAWQRYDIILEGTTSSKVATAIVQPVDGLVPQN